MPLLRNFQEADVAALLRARSASVLVAPDGKGARPASAPPKADKHRPGATKPPEQPNLRCAGGITRAL
jgi:hypothetical protein